MKYKEKYINQKKIYKLIFAKEVKLDTKSIYMYDIYIAIDYKNLMKMSLGAS